MRVLDQRVRRRQLDTWFIIAISWIAVGLLAIPVTSVMAKTPADYYVQSLPGQPDGPLLNMHAG